MPCKIKPITIGRQRSVPDESAPRMHDAAKAHSTQINLGEIIHG
jgi:hypothetical protein